MAKIKKSWIEESYDNRANILIENDDGHYYPRRIIEPSIEFIQFPEPHVLISDWYFFQKDD